MKQDLRDLSPPTPPAFDAAEIEAQLALVRTIMSESIPFNRELGIEVGTLSVGAPSVDPRAALIGTLRARRSMAA